MGDKAVQTVPLEDVIPTGRLTIVDADVPADEYEMSPGIHNLYCNLADDSDTIVYLPALAESVGGLYSVYVIAVDAGNKVTVKSAKSDPQTLNTSVSVDLAAATYFGLWYNTGLQWKLICSHTS